MGRSEKVLFVLVLLPLATKHWNLPLATKLDLSSPPSFSFFLKGRIWIIGVSIFWT
jgi:hypothetical protein